MDKNFMKDEREYFKVYSSADIKKQLNITAKMFDNRSKAIEAVYGISIDDFREDPTNRHSNFKLNIYEFELLKVIFSNIADYPFGTGKKLNDLEKKKLEKKEGAAFTNYLKNISNSIDSIQNVKLKAYIYASSTYESTMEWISAHDKLNETLSNFFQYTNTLDDDRCSDLYRKLSYKIDEVIYESIEEHVNNEHFSSQYESDSLFHDLKDYKFSYSKNKWLKRNNPDALNTTLIYEDQEIQSILKEYNIPNIDNIINTRRTIPKNSTTMNHSTLDVFLIDLLMNVHSTPLKQRINTALNQELKEIDIAHLSDEEISKKTDRIIKLETIKMFYGGDQAFSLINDNYYENILRISYAVNSYNNVRADLQTYSDRLKKINNEIYKLSNHEGFTYHFDKLYKELVRFSGVMMMNKNSFIEHGVDKDIIDYLFIDLYKIYQLIDTYHLKRNIKPEYMYNSPLLTEIHSKFSEATKIKKDKDVISNNVDKLTSWTVSQKFYNNLKNMNSFNEQDKND